MDRGEKRLCYHKLGFASLSIGGTAQVSAGQIIGRVGNQAEADNTPEHFHISAAPIGSLIQVDSHEEGEHRGTGTQGDRFSVLTRQSYCGEFSLGDEKW